MPVTGAALAIDSLPEDPVNGTTLNPACQGEIPGGIEYVNFVFLTQSGPIGPPNPLQFNPAMSGRRTSFPAGHLPNLALPGRGVRRARGGSRGRARAAAVGAGPASNKNIPGTRCRPRDTAAETRSRFLTGAGVSGGGCYPAGGGCWPAGRSLPVPRSAANTFCSMCQSCGCRAIPSSSTLASCWVMAAIFSCRVPVWGTGISW